MKVAEAQAVSLSSAPKIKMDDRKRSLPADSEDAYPSKRHATSSNGTHPRMDPDKEKDIEVRNSDPPSAHVVSHDPMLVLLLTADMFLHCCRTSRRMPFYVRCASISVRRL